MFMTKKIFYSITIFLISFLFGAHLFSQTLNSSTSNPANDTGLFVQVGAFGIFPVNSPLVISSAGNSELGPGGGMNLSVGWDFSYLGLGTKIGMGYISEDPVSAGAPTNGALWISWDLIELKFFILDWFDVNTRPLRPYGIFSFGFGGAISDLFGANPGGVGGKLGLGV